MTYYKKIKHICIVGGSVSGLFTLYKLIDLKIDHDCFIPLKITLIEKQAQVGDGMAYRLDHKSNLLNTAAGLLSGMGEVKAFCLNNQPSFLKWIRENTALWSKFYPDLLSHNISLHSYLPRGLVGIYLRELLCFYNNAAERYNCEISILYHEAVDLNITANKSCQIKLNNAQVINADIAVLALGGFMRNPFPEFFSHDYFYSNPWPLNERLQRLLSTDTIAIAGTKLGALDTLGILKYHGYQGKIYLVSRSGFLPTVKNQHHHYHPRLITPHSLGQLTQQFNTTLKLNDLFNLLKAELEHAAQAQISWQKLLTTKRFNLSWFKWQMQLAKSDVTLWQSVLAAIDEVIISAWQYLAPDDKNNFMRSFAIFWDIYRFSMPLETSTEIWEMLQQGQLSICSDLQRLQQKNNYFYFEATDCSNQKWLKQPITGLINATGINYNVATIDSPLIKNIIQRKIALPHPFGGFYLDFSNLNVQGHSNFYMLGDLSKGTHFFTNSYLLCSKQAAVVARHIFNTFRSV